MGPGQIGRACRLLDRRPGQAGSDPGGRGSGGRMTAIAPKRKADHWGLLAPRAVRHLLDREPAVRQAVIGFIEGHFGDRIQVAGPPTSRRPAPQSAIEIVPMHGAELPTVELRLAKVQNRTTGEWGVSITCSDRDLDEVARWDRLAHGIRD